MYLKIPFRQKLMSKIYVRTLKDFFYVNTRTINLVYHIRVVSCLSGNTNDIFWSLVKQNDTKKYSRTIFLHCSVVENLKAVVIT